jgi:Flp pilus assembly protein TadD
MGHLWLQVLPRPEKMATGADARVELELAWMENRLRKNARDDVALYNLASLSMAAGDAGKAAETYRRVLEARPDDVRTMTSLGSALEASGDWQGAQVEYRAAMAKDAYEDAVFDLAAVDLRHGELGEAEKLFRGLIAAHPEDAGARAGLGSVLLASDRPGEARVEFERALAVAPESFEGLYGLARIAVASGDMLGAEPLLVRALAVRNDADAQQMLAVVYAGTGSLGKALEHLEAWQKLRPDNAEPHRALAQVYGQMGRMEDAIREQKTVVRLVPGAANDWNDLGAMEARAGDKVAARRDLEHALQIEPGNAAAAANLRKL